MDSLPHALPNLSIIMEGAENIADHWDGGWGITRGVVDAAVSEISALASPASRTEALRRALEPDEMGFSDVECTALLLQGYARDAERNGLPATAATYSRTVWMLRAMASALAGLPEPTDKP